MIRLLLIPATLFCCIQSEAQPASVNVQTCRDSIVVRKAQDGALFLLWKAPGQRTLQDMALATGSEVSDIQALNPILRFRDPEPCDVLMTPFSPDKLIAAPGRENIKVWYEVQPGETLYRIARRIFGLEQEHLMQINQMSVPSVHQGQALLLGWLSMEELRAVPGNTAPLVQWYDTDTLSLTSAPTDTLHHGHLTTQKGVAWWNKAKPDPNFFALHRYAAANSYIEIRNPMFGRSVRAKVIGTIPPTYPEDISVIVSEGVARELGAIDTRFYAEMSYAPD